MATSYKRLRAWAGAEYPLLRFLERNGYDVSYQAGLDTHHRGLPQVISLPVPTLSTRVTDTLAANFCGRSA